MVTLQIVGSCLSAMAILDGMPSAAIPQIPETLRIRRSRSSQSRLPSLAEGMAISRNLMVSSDQHGRGNATVPFLRPPFLPHAHSRTAGMPVPYVMSPSH